MIKWLGLILLVAPVWVLADARFVEAPAECHFPYDNDNVGNEFKLQSCSGVIKTHPDGTIASAVVNVKQENVSGSLFVIDGEDVRDQDAYPGGTLTVETSGTASGTNCNIVDAGGTTYQTANWNSAILISRTHDKWNVNVGYKLTCSYALAQ